MAPFPINLAVPFGHWGQYVIYLLFGIAFGAVLEMSGFGNSKILAAQFYFKNLTVLKVMFGAIIVAMVGIFLTSGLGLLDYNLVWVNPTYLWPGIVGGLIMGVGFIVGGFCPGTSLAAASTLKVDGIFFVLGCLFGIFLFGETVGLYEDFWYSSYMGRFTLAEWLNLPYGVVVLLVVLMAIGMFAASEQAEKYIGKMDLKQAPKWRFGAAIAIILVAGSTVIIGQPSNAARWARLAPVREPLLDGRKVQIEPAEMLSFMHDARTNLIMIDVRSESDYNLFHVLDARHVEMTELVPLAKELQTEPANTVIVLMSNDELAATEAYRILSGESVINLYILEGGINNWLSTFSDEFFQAQYGGQSMGNDTLAFNFPAALGSRHPAAWPDPEEYELPHKNKVVLATKRAGSGGGCG